MDKLILASASPRRRELMKLISEYFEVIPSEWEEKIPENIDAFSAPEYLAVQKAKYVFEKHGGTVIGCDTVVISNDKILGKPRDEGDAKRMLLELSGKKHFVVTGCAVFSERGSFSFSQVTEVEFYSLSEEEIEEYVSTGEPLDKAGAYGIQGKGAVLVKGINGDYYNVVGLPVARLKRMLDRNNTLK